MKRRAFLANLATLPLLAKQLTLNQTILIDVTRIRELSRDGHGFSIQEFKVCVNGQTKTMQMLVRDES